MCCNSSLDSNSDNRNASSMKGKGERRRRASFMPRTSHLMSLPSLPIVCLSWILIAAALLHPAVVTADSQFTSTPLQNTPMITPIAKSGAMPLIQKLVSGASGGSTSPPTITTTTPSTREGGGRSTKEAAPSSYSTGSTIPSSTAKGPGNTGSSNTAYPNPTPMGATKRKVVLHPDLGHHHLPHHHSPWEMELGLVLVLVAVHVLALCFWMYLLYADREQKRLAKGAASSLKPSGLGYFGSDILAKGSGHGGDGVGGGSGSPSKGRQDRRQGSGAAGHGGGGMAWRTPKEILAAWGKARERERLGKV